MLTPLRNASFASPSIVLFDILYLYLCVDQNEPCDQLGDNGY